MRGSFRSKGTLIDLVIFDSSIIIDDIRSPRHRERLQSVTGAIRTSSVVLAELWRGAATPSDGPLLLAPSGNPPGLTPTPKEMAESGGILFRGSARPRLASATLPHPVV